jgi:hypothetical protein
LNETVDQKVALTWYCGGAAHWVTATVGGLPVVEYAGDRRLLRSQLYNPLSHLDLLPDLANLGARALAIGYQKTEGHGLRENVLHHYAASDGQVQRWALEFVRRHGQPWRAPVEPLEPDAGFPPLLAEGWAPQGHWAYRIDQLLWEAAELHDAVELARSPDASDSERLTLTHLLAVRILDGLRHLPVLERDGVRMEHVVTGLIPAAWYQLIEALAPGAKGWRVCKDPRCGVTFPVHHKNEKYHSERCRNRHATELHRQRERKRERRRR